MNNVFYDIENRKNTIKHFEEKNEKFENIKEHFNNKLANVCIDRIIKSNNEFIDRSKNEIVELKKEIAEHSIFDYTQLNKYSKLLQESFDSREIFFKSISINGNIFAQLYSYNENEDILYFNGDNTKITASYVDFLQVVITYKILNDKVILSNEELWQIYTIYYNHVNTDDLYINQTNTLALVRKKDESQK